MTIQEALDRIDMMRPNMVRKEFKIAALSELDGLIWKEIIQNHEDGSQPPLTPSEQVIWLSPAERTFDGTGTGESGEESTGFAGYDLETDPGTVLLAPFPYDEIYTWWLASKVDWQNLEIEKYNNDRTLFNNAYDTLSDWYTRTHMPKQRVREFRI